MKLTHPDSKHTVETDNPEPYLSQGWVDLADPDACPTCGATGDDPCKTASGAETSPHAARG